MSYALNKIGRGSKIGAIIDSNAEFKPAVFKDIFEFGKRKEFNLIVGKTEGSDGLVGIGYDLNDNFEINAGGFFNEEKLKKGWFVGGSYRF